MPAPRSLGSLPPGDPAEDDRRRWDEAKRLRREHPGWVIIWLAPASEFRAYVRLPGARRDTALSADAAEALADLIAQAEQARGRATSNPDDDLT
jgi:hypothetical protein